MLVYVWWAWLCFSRHRYDEPPSMESIENPRNRQRLPMAPWLASCWMLKAMPPMAKASETQPTIIVIQFGEKNTRYA